MVKILDQVSNTIKTEQKLYFLVIIDLNYCIIPSNKSPLQNLYPKRCNVKGVGERVIIKLILM